MYLYVKLSIIIKYICRRLFALLDVMLGTVSVPLCYTGTFQSQRVIGGTMTFGAIAVSRSLNAVSAIPAVNSNVDIIY